MAKKSDTREMRRILVTKARHGEDIFRKSGQKSAQIRWGGLRNPTGKSNT